MSSDSIYSGKGIVKSGLLASGNGVGERRSCFQLSPGSTFSLLHAATWTSTTSRHCRPRSVKGIVKSGLLSVDHVSSSHRLDQLFHCSKLNIPHQAHASREPWSGYISAETLREPGLSRFSLRNGPMCTKNPKP